MPRLLRLSDVRQTAVDDAPAGYRLALVGRLDLNRLGPLSLVATLAAAPLFIALTAPLGGPIDPRGGEFRFSVGPLDILAALVNGILILPVVHELIHGLAARLVGARPVYGIAPPVAAFCHFERLVSRGRYAFIVAAPLVTISVAGVALMPFLPGWLKGQVLLLLILNAGGAIGDLAMLWQARRAPADALIADTATGFEAYAPADTVRSAGPDA